MKRAILAVSFGARSADVRRRCIAPVVEALRREFPGWELREAFSSRTVVRGIRADCGFAEDEGEALARLRAEGYEDIVVSALLVIPGREYALVAAAAQGARISEPLLADGADLDWMARLISELAREEGRNMLMMGHGSDCAADEMYARLRAKLPPEARLACVDGAHTLDTELPALEALPERKVCLAPLMLVAGAHSRREMAGAEPDSWKSVLEARGFDVRVRMQGLGALEAVQLRFVEKLRRVIG